MTKMQRILPSLAALVCSAILVSCSSQPGSTDTGGAAPDTYRVKLETSEGDVVIQVNKEWSPRGADRFHQLVKLGFYDGARFFRVLPGFIVQVGMPADPALNAQWAENAIPADPPGQSNTPGTVTFAMRGGDPNSRTTQIFINLGHNAQLDAQGFTPFGRVVEGMEAVQRFYAEYGEGAPRGNGPDQGRIRAEGNAYLEREFPNLDYIKKATLLP
jgi:peptidyl-prolyl cis-trans isomerase A (cyclophilin A)